MKKTLLASAVLLALVSAANAANVEHISDNKSWKDSGATLNNPYLFDDSFVVNVTNGVGIDAQKQASTLGIGKEDDLTGKIEVVGTTAIVLGQGDGAMYADSIYLEGKNYGVNTWRHLQLTANSVTIKSNGNGVQFQGPSSGLTIDAGKVAISSNTIALNSAFKGKISVTGDEVTIDAPLALRVWGADKTNHIGSSLELDAGTLNMVGDVLADGSATVTMQDGTIKGHMYGTHGADLDLGKGSWVVAEGKYDDGDNVLKSLTGNGTIDMSQVEDSIVIKESMSGNATVKVDATKTNGLTVVGTSTATVSVVTDQNADEVTAEQASAMVTRMDGVEATAFVEEGKYRGAMTVGSDASVSTEANSIVVQSNELTSLTTLSMNRILMNDVRKRLGDLRAAEGTHGVWARYDGGKLSGASGLENDFTTVQVGIDTVPVVDAPRFGVAFAYTKSDADMTRGSADMDAFSLAFYGTKMYDNGMFVDVIGRMATADTDVVIDGNDTGSMDNVALSLSGEFGWRFDVTDKFYFEPQAELTYTYVNADTLALSSGHEYEFDSVNSLVGRVGFAAGFKCPDNFGDVYVRASAVHEFLGDTDVTLGNGDRMPTVDGEDTYVEFGIGAQFNVNKSTYVYVDIERTEGAKLEEDWRANVGVRYAF